MLRISNAEIGDLEVTLRLEGRVIGPWVGELERACAAALAADGRLTLDLSQVTFIDNGGVVLIRDLIARQVKLVGCSRFVDGQLRGE